MGAKKLVKASEEPQEENQEVQDEVVKEEVKSEEVVTKDKIDPEEIVLEPLQREETPVLRDSEEQAEEDPKTFDDVYSLLEQIDGKLDVIIRGL